MSAITAEVCDAVERGCGSPTGWRNGGRCSACRRAHNSETNRHRRRGSLLGADRAVVLAALRDGRGRDVAAALVGRTGKGLERCALGDGELRLALDGAPPPQQRAARAGDYLAAVARHGGSRSAARSDLGLEDGEVAGWRRTLPGFHDAERAVGSFARDPRVPPRRRISDDQLERAAEVLENGGTMKDAAAAAGMSAPSLRKNAGRCPRLDAVLPTVQSRRHFNHNPRKRSAETDRLLRELWSDPAFTARDIAKRLGASHAMTRVWAAALDLPPRAGVALPTRHQRDALRAARSYR